MKTKGKIFLAAPFTGVFPSEEQSKHPGPSTNAPRSDAFHLKKLITSLADRLQDADWNLFSAHRRESWGENTYPDELCVVLDFKELQASSALLAILAHPDSGGVHIELGWATASKIPVLLFLLENKRYSPLVTGLSAGFNVTTVWVKTLAEIPDYDFESWLTEQVAG